MAFPSLSFLHCLLLVDAFVFFPACLFIYHPRGGWTQATGPGRPWRQAVNELFDHWSSTASPGNQRASLPSRHWIAEQGPGVNEGARGAGGLPNELQGASEGGQTPTAASLLPQAPFSPIIALAGGAGKKRAPEGVRVRCSALSTTGFWGLNWHVSNAEECCFVLKIARKQILFNL